MRYCKKFIMLGQLVLLLQLFLYTLGQQKIHENPFAKPYQDTWFRKKPPPFPPSSSTISQEISLDLSKLPTEKDNSNAKPIVFRNSAENPQNATFNNETYQYYSVPNSTSYQPPPASEFKSLERVTETIEHYNLTNNLNLTDDDYYQYFGYKNENNSEIQFNFIKPSEINKSFEENSLQDLIQMPSENQYYNLNDAGPPTILYPFYENSHLDKNQNSSSSTSTTTVNYDLKSNIYNPLYEPLGPTTFYENEPGQNNYNMFNGQLEVPPGSFPTTQMTPQDLSIIDDLIAISSELISQFAVMRPGTLTESQEFEIAKKKMGHLQRTFGNLGNMMKNAVNAMQNRIKGGMQMLKKVGGSFKEMFDMMCQIGKQMMRDVGNFVKYMLNMDKGVMGFMSGIFGGGATSGGYVDSTSTTGGYGAPAEQNKDKDNSSGNKGETEGSSDKGSIKAQIAQKKAEAKAKVIEQKKAIKAQKAGGNKDESEEADNGGWSEEPQSWQDANGQSNEINEWKIPDENDSKINEWMEIMSSNNLIAAPTSHVADESVQKKTRKRKKKKKKNVQKSKSKSQSEKMPNFNKDSQITDTPSGEILLLDLEKKNRPLIKPSHSQHQQIIQKYFQNTNTNNNNNNDNDNDGEEKPPDTSTNSQITTISSFEKFGTKYYTNKISKKKKKKGHKNNRPSLSWDFYTFKK